MSRETDPTVGRRTFLRAAGAAGTAAALGGIGAASGDDPDVEGADEIVVGVSATATPEAVERQFPAGTEVVDRNDALGHVVVKLPEGAGQTERIDAAASISRVGGVKYVERNHHLYAFGATGDPETTEDPPVDDAGDALSVDAEPPGDPLFGEQYAPQTVNAPEAWTATRGEDVTIAVVDQGVLYDHPDLRERFGGTKGRDFVGDGSDPSPKDTSMEFHGTHVAGIAAATTGNGTGVAGISNARLLSARALNESGRGRLATVAEAIQWAADQGADVINLSLGDDVPSQTLENAVDYALDAGSLPVAAAGNDGFRGVAYPAAFDACLAVGAINDTEKVTYFSQFGPNLDVVAPGEDVLSCWTEVPRNDPYGGKYERISGTSMACPVVSGVAALALSGIEGDVSPDVVRYHLKNTAVDVGEERFKQGAGLVDAAAAVRGRSDIAVPTVEARAGTVVATPGYEVEFEAVESGDPDGEVVEHRWNFDDGTTATGREVSHAFDSPGQYGVTVTAVDDDGVTRTDAVDVQIRERGDDRLVCDEREYETVQGQTDPDESFTTTYEPTLDELCRLEVSVEGMRSDVDLYLTLDGRTPTTDDYDRESTSRLRLDSVHLGERALDDVDEVGVLVDAPFESAHFTLTFEEVGISFEGGDGNNEFPQVAATASPVVPVVGEAVTFDASGTTDPDGEVVEYAWDFKNGETATGPVVEHVYDEAGTYSVELEVTDDEDATAVEIVTVEVNAPPEPTIDVSTDAPSVGEWVAFDAAGSSDPDGSIEAHEWSFGDGVSSTDPTIQHAFTEPGEYTVALTVTDDRGATATTTRTVPVEAGGEFDGCGTLREVTTYEDWLYWLFFLDEGKHYYTAKTDDPCQVAIELEGPDGTDFDLYVTEDGSAPDPPGWFSENFDHRSESPDSSERVVIEDVDPGQTFGINAFADSGTGNYTVTVREIGTGG